MSQIIRVYTESPLAQGAQVTLSKEQAHYLRHVMRVPEGDSVRIFNGHDGEWQASIDAYSKREAQLTVQLCTRPQSFSPDLWLVFAPIKHGKIDFLSQKATELGVSCLQPVMTQHTAVDRVNMDRLRANVIEAAEQSERLDVPQVHEAVKLQTLLGNWPQDRLLLYGDESGHGIPAAQLLPALRGRKLALLIGPEGGFSLPEHTCLRTLPFARGFGMGSRIMRADTAALAALAVIQALCGDWGEAPAFRPE